MRNIQNIRKAYQQSTLDLENLSADPFDLFYKWWDMAVDAEVPEPNAMTLATVGQSGAPSARIVLLKGLSTEGFEFFTNYSSHKAKDLEANANVALVFLWKEVERQVRVEGTAEKLSFDQSQTYFQSRPRGSQIGAWASPQSQVIPDRIVLEEAIENITSQYENVDPLPCPEFWGGYIVRPLMIEFWQGRDDRLHDRFRYLKNKKGGNWSIDRLAP